VYIRPSVVRKGGRVYRYYRLVRSVRRNGKVVQKTVAQLGELDARGRREARALAARICGVRVDQQRAFFEEDPPSAPATVTVRLDQPRVERQHERGQRNPRLPHQRSCDCGREPVETVVERTSARKSSARRVLPCGGRLTA